MILRRRVYTIYKKELVDILRDRRTLIAMIVVPIVLYPLLMLGSVQAVSLQVGSLDEESFVIGVINDRDGIEIESLIRRDAEALKQERDDLDPESEREYESEESAFDPGLVDKTKIMMLDSEEVLKQAVEDREVHVGLIFRHRAPIERISEQTRVEFFADDEEVRSSRAFSRLFDLFSRTQDRINAARLSEKNLPATFVEPYDITMVNLSAPSSILGQILPLILILMTITGAIYPAIDLTAGERERGTMESLMVSPVPVIELIFGKFLVVTTVAIMGATLNLASVTATVWFGGFDMVISNTEGGVPIGKMVVILLCLIPFAVLMSAIMIAVCSFARTFKEAQNYVTPVIMAVLIPGGIAAMPTSRLDGLMLVVPVGNMVLFAREMLLGAAIPWWQTATVLISTSLYAAAAVAFAAAVFGRESVVFGDTASLKTVLSRRLMKPSEKPTVSLSLVLVALLFPAWFFIQTAMQPGPDESAVGLLRGTASMMPLLFIVLPCTVLWYLKVDVRRSLALDRPRVAHLIAAVMIGSSVWVLGRELSVLQDGMFGRPEILEESNRLLREAIVALGGWQVFLIIALVPSVCEELLFRGFLMTGLRGSARKWTCISASAVIFGSFHFLIFRLPVTVALGVVLGYVCWQSRSVFPGMVVHFLHNAIVASMVVWASWPETIGLSEETAAGHLPAHILAVGAVLLAGGLIVLSRTAASEKDR